MSITMVERRKAEHSLTHRLGCQFRVTSSRVTYAELSDAEMGFGGFAVEDQE